jgi:hypothetical protein
MGNGVMTGASNSMRYSDDPNDALRKRPFAPVYGTEERHENQVWTGGRP